MLRTPGSMIDPVLLAESRRLLNVARMIPEVVGAAQASEIGHGRASSAMPAGMSFTKAGGIAPAAASTLDVLGERINQAIQTGSDRELERANRWCAAELDAIQHSKAGAAETPVEFGERICAQYEGQLAGVVARAEMSTVTTIRKHREQDGRDARYGCKLAS